MNAITITEAGAPVAPSVIGFRLADDRVVGFRELGRITWRGLLKTGIATTIAAGATAVRGAHLAIEEISDTRAQLQARVDLLTRQRNEAVNRAAAAEAKARKPTRWSAAERDLLLELRATGMSYAKIAVELGTGRTASAVGAKARALAAKASAPAPTRKPSSTRPSGRKARPAA
jgi:hypothetical protein